jgi:uncharacterized RDD family membrane protein YckC
MRADPFATPAAVAAIDPARLEGVLSRRVFAYLIDAVIIGLILFAGFILGLAVVVLSFGLLGGVLGLLALVGPAYHTLTVGLGGATWGQRMLGLEVCDLLRRPPTLLQAIVQTAVFYLTVFPTGGLVLIAVLFFDRRRTLHDWMSGLQVLRRTLGAEVLPGERRR